MAIMNRMIGELFFCYFFVGLDNHMIEHRGIKSNFRELFDIDF